MDQIVVTWPEIIVIGVLWVVALSAILGFQFWRIEVNTTAIDMNTMVMRGLQAEVRAFGKKEPLADTTPTPHSISATRSRPALPYVGWEEVTPERARQGSREDTLGSWVPAAREEETRVERRGEAPEIEVVSNRLDDDFDDDITVDPTPLLHASGMGGVWEGDEEELDDRKTIEMRVVPNQQTLDVLRHVDESVQFAKVS